MVRFKAFSASALLLFAAFVLLLLTVISAPITRFSSLASVSNTKFGVFGYCYTNGSCSGIHIGYNTDAIISRTSGTILSRDLPLERRQSASGGGGGVGSTRPAGGSDSMFNLPSGTRSNLSNVLVVHVVAAGLTLILFLMAIFGHLQSASQSSGYWLGAIILSIPTLVLTLLAFLIDILIFVPNLDWGTWITLGATVLNAVVCVLLCASRRKMKARVAMRKRIAENDDLNHEHYYNSQHLQDPVVVPEPEMEQLDKATLPRFNHFDLEHPDPVDTETIPLNRREPDNRSMRSESASLTSPPRYPATGGGYTNVHEMQELRPNAVPVPDYSRARIPYGNPPRRDEPEAYAPRPIEREDSYNSGRLVAPPLAHAQEPLSRGHALVGDESDNEQLPVRENWRTTRAPLNDTGIDDGEENDWNQRARRGPPRSRGQRAVSGPRPMPQSRSEPRMPVRSSSGSYYEDVPPQFDQGAQRRYQEGEYLEPRSARGPRRHAPQGSASFERPPDPQQPRSPDTLSNSSHFTSVSQRGINPAWRGDQPPANMRPFNGPPRQERRGPPKPNILADNPDFVLPGSGAGRSRLPGSRRPGAIPALSASNLSAGPSPYAITKAV